MLIEATNLVIKGSSMFVICCLSQIVHTVLWLLKSIYIYIYIYDQMYIICTGHRLVY